MWNNGDPINRNKSAHLHRVSWKKAIAAIFGAPWRLHHYRDTHTRMMRHALCTLECAGNSRTSNDE